MDDDRETQFLELRDKHEEALLLLRLVSQQAQAATTSKKRVQVMSQELEALPNNAFLYKNIGKAYFLATKPEIMAELTEVSGLADEQLNTLASKEDHAKKVLKETEAEIRELMSIAVSKTG